MPKRKDGKRGKPRGKPFKKGNPGGKMKEGKRMKLGKGYLKRCFTFMQDEGWDAIFDLARQDEDKRLKLDAHKFVAHYAHGKPKETVDLTAHVGAGVAAVRKFIQGIAELIRKVIPTHCPHCKAALKIRPAFSKGLLATGAELVRYAEQKEAEDE